MIGLCKTNRLRPPLPRPAILSPQVLASIPALVEQGLRKADIAARLGCKESTLKVRCSIAGISLRPRSGGRKRTERRAYKPRFSLSHEALAGLRFRAAAMGCSEGKLASDLLEVIARDDLYDAVLDSTPLQSTD
jgi:hypothetical protein